MRWGVKHRVGSCRGSLGSIRPKRSCSKWSGRETRAGLACSAHGFRRSANISWKLLTQIIVLYFSCFIICFLHCSSWLLLIFDQGHVSVNKRSNKSAFCSFFFWISKYIYPKPSPSNILVPHPYLSALNVRFITSPLKVLQMTAEFCHLGSLFGEDLELSSLSCITQAALPESWRFQGRAHWERRYIGGPPGPHLKANFECPPSVRKVLMINPYGLEISLEATC